MNKAEGAFLTISELAAELGLPQHILRYWESRFPQLRPLQRSGNRRYYRPADVMLARRINQLLNVEGFTVRGAQKALSEVATPDRQPATGPQSPPVPASNGSILARLEAIRALLAEALET
ncbi:MerR family transcriptional regulator [Sphingobium sp. AN641]|uniref:MerR family transcriptional regulator n=1 Tax=Sphingobium sp. AN641 TaxID=3133443 RepID=UPI0030BDE61C